MVPSTFQSRINLAILELFRILNLKILPNLSMLCVLMALMLPCSLDSVFLRENITCSLRLVLPLVGPVVHTQNIFFLISQKVTHFLSKFNLL